MNNIIKFPELSPIESFERQLNSCPSMRSTVRGAVSTLQGTKNVFLIWESEDSAYSTEKKCFQFKTNFNSAEPLFFELLSTMGKNAWCCKSENVQDFLQKLNNTLTTLEPNHGVTLPEIFFRKTA